MMRLIISTLNGTSRNRRQFIHLRHTSDVIKNKLVALFYNPKESTPEAKLNVHQTFFLEVIVKIFVDALH